jgi:hypothetical protein
MNAIPYDKPEEEWDSYQDGTEGNEQDFALPGRPRRQWFNRKSAALFAVLLGAIGFYAGVRVEKSQVSNSSSTTGALGVGGGAAALPRAAAPRAAAPRAAARPAPAGQERLHAPARAAPQASVACSVAAPVASGARPAGPSERSAASAATTFTSPRPAATR